MQFLTITPAAVFASLVLSHAANAAEFYVSPVGKNTNSGAQDSPLQTIQAAVDKAQPGDSVIVRAGTYRESVVLPRSGNPGAPITVKTFSKEKVVVSGTEIVSGWKAVEGKLYSAPVSANFYQSKVNYSNQVFVDGKMVNLARWPNTALDVSRPVKSTVTKFISKTRDTATNWTTSVFEDDNLLPKTDGYYVGCEITIQPNKDAWSWILSGVVTEQKGNRLTIKSRSDMGKDGKQEVYAEGSRYWITNAKKLLDANGEWFHDTGAGLLHLQLPDGGSPVKRVVEARKRDFAFDLSDRSYIVLQGFHLFACTLTSDSGGMGDGLGWDENGKERYPWRSPGTTPDAHHIVLDSLNVTYPSHFTDVSGHFYYQHGMTSGIILAGRNNIIQNSRIQFSAGNGIALYGRENKALNNIIEDVNYSATDCAGINTLGGGIDTEIGFNTIRRTGRSGITIREMANSDANKPKARVHHNDIGDFMLQDWDGGAIYTASQDANFTRIDHNWMHDATGHTVAGFYPDYTKNWIVDHNVTWNVEWGIHLEGQHESGVMNALVFNNTTLSRDQFIGIGNGQAPGSYYFNNIHNQNFGKAADGARERSHNLQWDNRTNSATDPKFTNLATSDFTLQADSPARDAGKGLGTVSTLQPGNPEVVVELPFAIPRDGKPDLGAYEHGEPIWKAGSTLAQGVIPPAAPSAMQAVAVAASRVNLSWNDAADNETGFSIERKTAASAWKQVGIVPTNTTEFYDNGLSKSTAYSYRVRAVNSAGTSGFSPIATAKTPSVSQTDARIVSTADAPKIDGQVDGLWNKAKAFPIANMLGGTITDNADLSGSWRALWDTKNLYVLIEVIDDKVLGNEGAAWYSVDSAEIYLDTDDSKKKTYDRINDFQMSFGAQTGALNLGQNSARDKMTFPFAVVKTEAGYRVEAALPWSEVLGYAPQASALIGFDIHLTDSDDGMTWKGKKTWHTKDNSSWFDPRLNASIELVK